jgi:Zn finger protein HypA/HybF involved in hydrogenase expression
MKHLLKNKNIVNCPFCKSTDLKFQEKTSQPINVNIRTIIFSASTVFQRKKQVLKCNQCNLEIKSDKMLSNVNKSN